MPLDSLPEEEYAKADKPSKSTGFVMQQSRHVRRTMWAFHRKRNHVETLTQDGHIGLHGDDMRG